MGGAERDLRLALELADAADAETLSRFRSRDFVVDTKRDDTPVTDADRAVETVLRDRIARERPADAVLGEEYGAGGPPGGTRRWIIDPVDGTANFVRGVPVWATLIAMEEDGTMSVGVVSAPALGRRWWAARTLGSYADGCPLAVSTIGELAGASLSYSTLADWARAGRLDRLAALAGRVWRSRAYGDFWSHVLVAEGAVDLSCELEVSLWDMAAVQVVVEEAGGRFTDLDGRRAPDGGSVLCSNGRLHDAALALLAGSDGT